MVGWEAVSAGSFDQRRLNPSELTSIEEWFPPGAGSCLQSSTARLLPLPEPAGDAHPAHAKPAADISLRDVAFGEKLSGLLPETSEPFVRSAMAAAPIASGVVPWEFESCTRARRPPMLVRTIMRIV